MQGAAAPYEEVTHQAAAIAYINDFWWLMLLTFVAMPLVYFLRVKPGVPAPAPVLEH